MPALTGSNTNVKDKDRWRTPPELFKAIEKRLGWVFGIDLAAESHNALCEVYIPPEADSLNTDWYNYAALFGVDDKAGWLNPPFSNVSPWVDCVIKSELSRQCVITNAATDTDWWFRMANAASQVWIMKGRVSFIHNETGKRVSGNNMGQTIFIFDTKEYDQHMITVETRVLLKEGEGL